jgi:thymidylate synthase ThyX
VNFQPTAAVISDSVSPDGVRLTTLEVVIHRFVLAEFNTHRVFSRNSASSRAIPFAKMRAKALETPALPVSWPAEQKGMQGGTELSASLQASSERVWLDARDAAVEAADSLHSIGVHKSVINRLLEPFLPHTVIVSATDWQGFWNQRCHKDAQPEIRVAAEAMKRAYDYSMPTEISFGQFHLPYVREEELQEFDQDTLIKLSTARCARVSYLTHSGVRDVSADITLYDRLVDHTPMHASPLEHVATPGFPRRGNFKGWVQWREVVEDANRLVRK